LFFFGHGERFEKIKEITMSVRQPKNNANGQPGGANPDMWAWPPGRKLKNWGGGRGGCNPTEKIGAQWGRQREAISSRSKPGTLASSTSFNEGRFGAPQKKEGPRHISVQRMLGRARWANGPHRWFGKLGHRELGGGTENPKIRLAWLAVRVPPAIWGAQTLVWPEKEEDRLSTLSPGAGFTLQRGAPRSKLAPVQRKAEAGWGGARRGEKPRRGFRVPRARVRPKPSIGDVKPKAQGGAGPKKSRTSRSRGGSRLGWAKNRRGRTGPPEGGASPRPEVERQGGGGTGSRQMGATVALFPGAGGGARKGNQKGGMGEAEWGNKRRRVGRGPPRSGHHGRERPGSRIGV